MATANLDDWIVASVRSFLSDRHDLLFSFLRVVDEINTQCKSYRAVGYGFEWLVTTIFFSWILQREGVSDQEICKKNNRVIPDISFIVSSQNIIIEVKTIERRSVSCVIKDVNKVFPTTSWPYFLVFGYPYDHGNSLSLAVRGAECIFAETTVESFRCFIFKKSGSVYIRC